MQTLHSVQHLLGQLKFHDWMLVVREVSPVPAGTPIEDVPADGFRIYAHFTVGDSDMQTTRKWLVSAYATRSEIVQTVFKMVMTALEHEAREAFLYDGEAIFGPHFDIEALYDIAHRKRLDVRKPLPAQSPRCKGEGCLGPCREGCEHSGS